MRHPHSTDPSEHCTRHSYSIEYYAYATNSHGADFREIPIALTLRNSHSADFWEELRWLLRRIVNETNSKWDIPIALTLENIVQKIPVALSVKWEIPTALTFETNRDNSKWEIRTTLTLAKNSIGDVAIALTLEYIHQFTQPHLRANHCGNDCTRPARWRSRRWRQKRREKWKSRVGPDLAGSQM